MSENDVVLNEDNIPIWKGFEEISAYINLNGIINKQKRLIERLNRGLVREKHKKEFFYNALKKEIKYRIKKL